VKVSRETCLCGAPARPGQRNCSLCHARAQREFRARRADELYRLRRLVDRLGLRRRIAA